MTKAVAGIRENADGMQAQLSRLDRAQKDAAAMITGIEEQFESIELRHEAQLPPTATRRDIELRNGELGVHRLGLANLGHLAVKAHHVADPLTGRLDEAHDSIKSIEQKLQSIRETLEHVQDNHLTVEEFGEFATGMAGAHERVWKRFEDTIRDIQKTLANNNNAATDTTTNAGVQRAEVMITDFFEQLSNMGVGKSPELAAEHTQTFQSMQAQVAHIEKSHALQTAGIAGIQAQLAKINELVMARRESATTGRRQSIGTQERLVGIETMMKSHLNSEEFQEFRNFIEFAVTEVTELAHAMQARLNNFESPLKSKSTVAISIEGVLKELTGAITDIQKRVHTIESIKGQVKVGDDKEASTSLDGNADTARVLLIESAVEDLRVKLKNTVTLVHAKAETARVERAEASITGVQAKVAGIEEVVSELADAVTAYLENQSVTCETQE